MANQTMQTLGNVLDKESYDWMTVHLPDVAEALEGVVAKGEKPETIKRFVTMHAGGHRNELAMRCQAAARYLVRVRVGVG